MTYIKSDYTLLPFYNPITAAKFCAVISITLLIFTVLKAIIRQKSMTLRRAPFSVWSSAVTAALLNTVLCTFLYWQWALIVGVAITLAYAFYVSGEVKVSNSEERLGVWGLNKDIRRIRGEIFNDMTLEEQAQYRKNVKEFKFNPIIFFIAVMIAPLIFMGVCNMLDIGYLFTPVFIG